MFKKQKYPCLCYFLSNIVKDKVSQQSAFCWPPHISFADVDQLIGTFSERTGYALGVLPTAGTNRFWSQWTSAVKCVSGDGLGPDTGLAVSVVICNTSTAATTQDKAPMGCTSIPKKEDSSWILYLKLSLLSCYLVEMWVGYRKETGVWLQWFFKTTDCFLWTTSYWLQKTYCISAIVTW